jgi:prepilin-type processing-associated H-X9-DG protein
MTQIKKARGSVWKGDGATTDDAYGNVSFCDGHGEFFGRKDALRQRTPAARRRIRRDFSDAAA